jgi:hypothetical protein
MPWNPARLEQRIARAWRKHQKRPVQVINLVSEHSIEHRMLSLLEQKRSMAAGVVDGKGENEMALPSGRAAFLERIETLMGTETKQAPAPPNDPIERLRDDILNHWSNRLERVELHGKDEQQTLLVVADRLDETLRSALNRQLQQQFPDQTPQLQLLDREAYATIQQLIEAGVLSASQETARMLYRAPADRPKNNGQSKRLREARDRLALGEHKRRMAKVLSEGGFAKEALAPMSEAVETALHALTHWRGHDTETAPDPGLIESALVQSKMLPAETLTLVARLREDHTIGDEAQAAKLLARCDSLLSRAAAVLESTQGS